MSAPGARVRVATLNLWGRRGDWPARRRVLAEGFARLAPDLVVLQEAVVTDAADQVAEVLGGGWHVAHHGEREPGGPGDVEPGQGISLASRWPLRDVQEVPLHVTPRTAGFACTAQLAEVHAPEPLGPLLLVNHLPSWQVAFEHERELQAVAVADAVERRMAEGGVRHVVLAGDLDADPEAASLRFLTGRQSLQARSVCYRDAWESAHPGERGPTFTPESPLVADPDWPFRQIDHVLVRCGDHGGPTLRIATCRRIFDAPEGGVWASDHFGLVADLVPYGSEERAIGKSK